VTCVQLLNEVSQQIFEVLDHQDKQQPIMALVLHTGKQEGKRKLMTDDSALEEDPTTPPRLRRVVGDKGS